MQWQIFSIVLTATQQRKMAIRTQQMYCVRNVIIGFALNVKKWDTEEIAAQQKIDDGKKKSRRPWMNSKGRIDTVSVPAVKFG